jgi:YesN/AraC family two-component response regulator
MKMTAPPAWGFTILTVGSEHISERDLAYLCLVIGVKVQSWKSNFRVLSIFPATKEDIVLPDIKERFMYTLMIVEDELLERKALRKIVSEAFRDKIAILEDATSGAEAIIKARQGRPDIILMDIGLPEMGGLESQKQIVSFLPFVQTVMITAYSDFYYVQNALQLKAVDYLLKPVKPKNLIESLAKVLQDLDEIQSRPKPPDVLIEEVSAIKEAVSYISQHFRQEISLTSIAQHVHLNAQYLSRSFKKQMGVSYIDYMNSLRIHYAKEMLRKTDLPIYRIAVEAGFTDTTYFSRVFVKYENQSPTTYRKLAIE